MDPVKRPYLVIPKLIQQPTWGGHYICQSKNLNNQPFLMNKKIGQSYELFGQSKLLLTISDPYDRLFVPELGFPDNDKIIKEFFPYQKYKDFITLSDFVKTNPEKILGKNVFASFNKMPLLIKFTQAVGNSFQLHIKPTIIDRRWQPKPESWFYFEDGLLTYGIKKEAGLVRYKKTCQLIDQEMKQLSVAVKNGKNLRSAQEEADLFIKKLNPWQFVNLHKIKKGSLVDLSLGGIHHSWEEDMVNFPLGNVLYEVQREVMDPVATLRCFDKGKIKKNGDIREIHIDDYFKFLGVNPDNNDVATVTKKQKGGRLLTTKNYCLDIFEITGKIIDYTGDSFCHLFVKNGEVVVESDFGAVRVRNGYSCFLPKEIEKYKITTKTKKSTVLKTFIEF